MSKILELTFYKTDADYERGTAMLTPYDPNDWKSIEVTFTRENDCWVLEQPDSFKFRKISHSEIIIEELNQSETNPLYKLKINRHVYPTIDEIVYYF